MAHEPEPHHFDGEPVKELAPGEPNTPMWLPLLGAAFFAVAGLWWGLSTSHAAAGAAASASASASAAPSIALVPQMPGARTPVPMATGLPTGATPEQIKQIRENLMQARQRAQGQPAQPGQPGQPGAQPPPGGAPAPLVPPAAPPTP